MKGPPLAEAQSTLSPRQAQILDVAMRIIATQGARRFTVQALACEVGVTGGAIYRHFHSMEAIADAIVERIGRILFEGFPPDAPTPIERLRLFFLRRAETIHDNPDVSRLLLSDNLSQAFGTEYAVRLQEFKRKTQGFLVSCLTAAAHDGTLSVEISPEVGAIILMGTIQSLSHSATRLVFEQQASSLAAQVWSALERMLRGSSRPAERNEPDRKRVSPKRGTSQADAASSRRSNARAERPVTKKRVRP
jgi:AcrR family transcriptional regulator